MYTFSDFDKYRNQIDNMSDLDIGMKLYEIREDMGITQINMSMKLGVSLPTLSRWERGIFPKALRYFLLLEAITNKSLYQLIVK